MDRANQKFLEVWKTDDETIQLAPTLIEALIYVISSSQETTMQGLMQDIQDNLNYTIKSVNQDQNILDGRSGLTLDSIGKIFMHYISKKLVTSTNTDMSVIKESLIQIGNDLKDITSKCKEKIKNYSFNFIKNGITILVHGYSKLVEYLLISAAEKRISFKVFVTETRPNCEGYKMCERLSKYNIPTELILDSAAAYFLEQCDIVLVGAETVAENGGIINRIGTYNIALCAKMLRKPFYVVCESFKFTRLYPLSQRDIPKQVQGTNKIQLFSEFADTLKQQNPLCDYTPPDLITLLFTDIGIFTPSAVSDELIQIFNL